MEISIKTIGGGEVISNLLNTMSILLKSLNIMDFVFFIFLVVIVSICFLLYNINREAMIKLWALCGAILPFLYFLTAPICTIHLTDTLFKTEEKIENTPICVAGPVWIYNSLGGDLSKIAYDILPLPVNKIQQISKEAQKNRKSVYTDEVNRFVGYEVYRKLLLDMLDIYSDFDCKRKPASDFDTPKSRKCLVAFQHVKERIRRDPNLMFQLNKPHWEEVQRRLRHTQNS